MKMFFSVFFCCFSLVSFAQKKLLPGYIITQSGDSLYGSVNYSNARKTPREMQFAGKDGMLKTYTAIGLRQVVITGKDYYTSAIVKRSARPVDFSLLTPDSRDSVVVDTLFLRMLVSGNLNVYEFIDFKDHYYLQRNQGEIEELKYEIEVDNNSNLTVNNTFRSQLKNAIEGTPAALTTKNRLQQLKYQEDQLVSFVGLVNKLNGGNQNLVTSRKKGLVKYFIGTGFTLNSLKIKGDRDEYLSYVNATGSIRPAFQAGIDLSSSRNWQRLILRGELSYYGYAATGKGRVPPPYLPQGQDINYEFIMHAFNPSLNLMYNIISTPRLDIYFGAGYGVNFAGYKTNKMIFIDSDGRVEYTRDPYLAYEPFWSQITTRIGAVFNKKIEAGFVYTAIGSFSNYAGVSQRPNTLNAQVNYRF
jgi:hypothetical protein